jgi:hypothetical protein
MKIIYCEKQSQVQIVWLCIHVDDLLDVSQPFRYAAVSLMPDGLSMQYLFSTAFSDVAMMMSENALHRPFHDNSRTCA